MTDSLKSWMVSDLASRLGLNPRQIDIHERLNHYGLDSAEAARFIGALSAMSGRPLPPTLVWKYPTVDSLARFLSGESEPLAANGRAYAGSPGEPVAIIGISCRFPHAENPAAFWRLLRDGLDAVTEVPADRWSIDAVYDADPTAPGKMNTRWGGFLERVDSFDPQFFGISPREAIDMDPQQRLALELAWEALEDAAISPASLNGTSAGVYFGAMWNEYGRLAAADAARITPHTATGQDSSIIAARVSYAMGLSGPSLTVNTACSSSLVAVHLACQALRAGDCEIAVAGGVNLILTPASTVAMTKFGAMSPDGRCKAFDARANGYVRGEGGGAVVLKPLSQALASGDPVYCVIPGSAVNNDGFSNGLTAPNPEAQEDVLRDAYARAGIAPQRVHYVEAHGTGTMLGDPIEAGALGSILGAGRAVNEPLLIGSVKTNIGHLEAAAGIAGLIKVVLAIRHRSIPASLHFQTPNPHVPFQDLGLKVQQDLGPWPRASEAAVAGVSSFGFGGTNCHVVVQEMSSGGSPPPRSRPKNIGLNRKLAFVFSGNGSQWAGMGRGLLAEPVFRGKLRECDEILGKWTDWSLLEVLTIDRGNRLNQVSVSQPALFALQVSLAAVWQSWGIRPDVVVGHSVGEVAAAHVAGVLSLEDAVCVVYHRSRLLQLKSGTGGMAVADIPVDEVERLLRGYENSLCVAACNSPVSTVVSGNSAVLDNFLTLLESRGISAQRVRVDVAYHSPEVDGLKPELLESLRGIVPRPGVLPVMSTVTGAALDGRQFDANYWVENMRRPVLFSGSVAGIIEQGIDIFVEISPHPILLRAVETTLRHLGRAGATFASFRQGANEQAALRESLDGLLELVAPPPDASPERPAHVLTLSAKSEDALRALAQRFEDYFSSHPRQPFADVCHTANTGRAPFRHRLAVAAGSAAQARQGLAAFSASGKAAGVFSGQAPAGGCHVAFVFAGPGTPYVGMGRRLYDTQPAFRETLIRCDEALRPYLDRPLLSAIYPEESGGPPIDRAMYSQPALFALEYALAELWRSWGVEPVAMAGHGIGELAAACVSGVFSLEDALKLAVHWGRSPEVPALAAFEAAIADVSFHAPRIPIVSNLTGQPVHDEILQPSYWRAQAQDPSPPVNSAGALREQGANVFLEIGAGLERDWEQLLESLCRLYVQGAPIDWYGFDKNYARRRVHLPTYPFERDIYWPDPAPPQSDWISPASHPLLGRRLRSAQPIFESRLDSSSLPFLNGRRFSAPIVFPAAAYLGLAMASALETLGNGPFAIESLLLQEPLVLAARGFRILQVIVNTDDPEHASVRFFSRSEDDVSGWTMHAGARVLPAKESAAGVPVSREGRMSADEYYRMLSDGLQYGTASAIEDARTNRNSWLYRVEWQKRNRVEQPAADRPPARWLVIEDAQGLARRLAERLRLSRQTCELVSSASERSGPAGSIVYFPGVDAATPDEALAACEGVLKLVHSLARESASPPAKLWLVTRHSHAVAGSESGLNPAQAPLWGLFRALALEHPEWLGGIIDLDGDAPPESQVSMLAAELLHPDAANAEDQIVLRGGERYAPRLVRDRRPDGPEEFVSFDPKGAYLVTGGLGVLGLRLANWLVARGARYLVLAGRRPPGMEQLETIRTIEKLGATVIAVAADSARREQMEAVIAEFGAARPPLRGVFHLASVWSVNLLEEMDAQTFGAMFKAKAAGAWHLHELTQHMNLDWFVLYSSAASILGAQYLGHYAAANEFLNALARYRRARKLSALAVNWGPWKDTPFSSPDGLRPFEEFGLPPMDSDAALDVLGSLLASGVTEQMVARIDWSVLQPVYESKRRLPLLDEIRETATLKAPAPADSAPQQVGALERLKSMPKGQLQDALTELVRQHFAYVLKFRSSRLVDTGRGFFEMGMDSLTSVEFRRRLEADLECALPSTLTFTYPNVDLLVAYLAAEVLQLRPGRPQEPATAAAADDRLAVEVETEGLTEDEVHASLIEELNRAGY